MKKQYYMVFLLMLALSCRKEPPPAIVPVKYTTVSGHVYSRVHQKPLQNIPMVVNRLLTVTYAFASSNQGKIVASTQTDSNGYFQMSFADTIPADGFVVTYPGKILYGASYSGISL